jgi:excisionase family DNA binding protein
MKRALPEAKFYSISEAAAIAGVSQMTIRRAIDRGEMKRYQLGRKILIRRADYWAWLDRLNVTSAA